MRNIYWLIEDALAGRCGPACEPWDPRELHDGGIRAVISLDRESVDEAVLRKTGIEHLPLYQPMMLLHVEEYRRDFLRAVHPAFDFIDAMRTRNAPVLVHCYYGCDRTGVVLAGYLMAREGLDAATAIQRVRAVQPMALAALGYAETVELFGTLEGSAW